MAEPKGSNFPADIIVITLVPFDLERPHLASWHTCGGGCISTALATSHPKARPKNFQRPPTCAIQQEKRQSNFALSN